MPDPERDGLPNVQNCLTPIHCRIVVGTPAPRRPQTRDSVHRRNAPRVLPARVDDFQRHGRAGCRHVWCNENRVPSVVFLLPFVPDPFVHTCRRHPSDGSTRDRPPLSAPPPPRPTQPLRTTRTLDYPQDPVTRPRPPCPCRRTRGVGGGTPARRLRGGDCG